MLTATIVYLVSTALQKQTTKQTVTNFKTGNYVKIRFIEKKQQETSKGVEYLQSLRELKALYLSVGANEYHYQKDQKDQEKVMTTTAYSGRPTE